MKLINQVCSLELAKKLKEFGVKQESLFYYQIDTTNEEFIRLAKKSKDIFEEDISAFTVAELGEMLPQNLNEYPLVITKLRNTWLVEYLEEGECGGHFWNNDWMAEIEDNTESNARAKMLIYLLENKLI